MMPTSDWQTVRRMNYSISSSPPHDNQDNQNHSTQKEKKKKRITQEDIMVAISKIRKDIATVKNLGSGLVAVFGMFCIHQSSPELLLQHPQKPNHMPDFLSFFLSLFFLVNKNSSRRNEWHRLINSARICSPCHRSTHLSDRPEWHPGLWNHIRVAHNQYLCNSRFHQERCLAAEKRGRRLSGDHKKGNQGESAVFKCWYHDH